MVNGNTGNWPTLERAGRSCPLNATCNSASRPGKDQFVVLYQPVANRETLQSRSRKTRRPSSLQYQPGVTGGHRSGNSTHVLLTSSKTGSSSGVEMKHPNPIFPPVPPTKRRMILATSSAVRCMATKLIVCPAKTSVHDRHCRTKYRGFRPQPGQAPESRRDYGSRLFRQNR
jgi:hypothetical protein